MSEPGDKLRFLHPPRTGGSSIVRSWGLGKPEYRSHSGPHPSDGWRYGFTRNPWDRVVSLYHLAWGNRYDRPDFNQWVQSGMNADDSFGERWHRDLTHPTVWWLEDADWIGRFETRDDDLVELAGLLDRDVPGEHIAWSHGREPYPEYYDDRSIEIVAEKYKPDIEAFGYGFADA